jgi:DNA-directed RNA polymerase subunit K/omega
MDGYDPSKNTTVPIMTRFERAKVLGMRTEQLARGAEPMIDVGDWNGRSPSDVAEEELAARATPFVLVRPMPNGKRELWRIRDLVTTLT